MRMGGFEQRELARGGVQCTDAWMDEELDGVGGLGGGSRDSVDYRGAGDGMWRGLWGLSGRCVTEERFLDRQGLRDAHR